MTRVKVRYLTIKPQKGGHSLFYWQPSATLRKLGFITRRLAENTNRLEDAIVEAEQLNRELDRWRMGEGEPMVEPGTLPWLVKIYRGTERYADLAPKTQRSYDQGIALLESWSAKHEHPPISNMEPRHVREMLGEIESVSMRHLGYRTLRLLMSFAVVEGHAQRNPARGLRIRGPAARDTYWTPEQVEAFIQVTTKAGRPSLALALQLAVNLGQREGDVLRLAWSQYVDGTFTLRQRKTGRLVTIPATTELKDILTAATSTKKSPTIVIAEVTGQPYREDYFRHEFARIRTEAGLPSTLRFMDLRRTAVVRLAEAGCSVPEIAAVTGHSIDRTARILEVYLPRTAPMARSAVARLDKARAARTKSGGKLEV